MSEMSAFPKRRVSGWLALEANLELVIYDEHGELVATMPLAKTSAVQEFSFPDLLLTPGSHWAMRYVLETGDE